MKLDQYSLDQVKTNEVYQHEISLPDRPVHERNGIAIRWIWIKWANSS